MAAPDAPADPRLIQLSALLGHRSKFALSQRQLPATLNPLGAGLVRNPPQVPLLPTCNGTEFCLLADAAGDQAALLQPTID